MRACAPFASLGTEEARGHGTVLPREREGVPVTGRSEEHQPRILIVDDQEENLDLLEAFLSVHDYQVVQARDGREALARVAQEPPDLILLDTHMPAPDGFQVCRELKQNEQTRLIPGIIVTTSGELESRIRGIDAGADD